MPAITYGQPGYSLDLTPVHGDKASSRRGAFLSAVSPMRLNAGCSGAPTPCTFSTTSPDLKM
ncbi:Uncharacterised protein [Mycobacteroides abscessus subsp. abscessus]|nr:Uncharacterised protein [Mycobacteroides abscessus subsp. abscessus]SHT71121.1 Uncharacterised protein [Mycobacteroides abscessus subsp. abscessus]SHU93012.1 Uncharacterised protein [Mycobacteroides abscessus subsp. abscessus]SHX08278.1 Uncharacterised protein [Mycobacteroides abscessus subsp. abscessus]SIB05764.1 Uncharacterised protein [Mycobacteroides abscessus subsp. abscessus]